MAAWTRLIVPYGLPKGIPLFFNTRQFLFADRPRLRGLARRGSTSSGSTPILYAGAYRRSKSFFDDSELSAAGRPASDKERALLAPFPGAVREDILEGRAADAAGSG